MPSLATIAASGFASSIALAVATRHPRVQSVDDALEVRAGRARALQHVLRAAHIGTLPGEPYMHPTIGAASTVLILVTRRAPLLPVLAALAAASIGAILAHHAVKLVYITTSDGLVVNGSLARQVSVDELSSALDKGQVAPAQVSKARHAVAACRFGVPRVHIINGRVDEGLLAEVFSNEGIGTLVYANEYRQIRRARRRDIRSIQQLIQASVENEELLPRSQAAIERQIDDYYIYEVDRNPIACVALHVYPEQKTGEVACLRVRPSHENQGIGRRMTQYVEERAREMGLEKLLALSTQAYNFFGSKSGFSEGTPDDLPPGRREKYEQSGRHSRVLVKKL